MIQLSDITQLFISKYDTELKNVRDKKDKITIKISVNKWGYVIYSKIIEKFIKNVKQDQLNCNY